MSEEKLVDSAKQSRQPKSKHATREGLLKVAELLFTRNGYTSVSTRDLADAAGVNLAAINYHFGSKAKLFTEVVHRSMTQSGCVEARLDFNGPITSQSDAARAIGEYVVGFLQYLLNPLGPQACQMMLRESFTDHSDDPEMFEMLISSVVEKFMRPLEDSLVEVVMILKPKLDKSDAVKVARSIAGQCAFYGSHKMFIERINKQNEYGELNLFEVAKHVVEFSLRGAGCDQEHIKQASRAIDAAVNREADAIAR